MARRSHLRVAGIIENMTAFVCDHGESYELFGAGGGERLAERTGAPLIAAIPFHPAVVAQGDAGSPITLASPQNPVATAFSELAQRVMSDIGPQVKMPRKVESLCDRRRAHR
jgi:ATP-binding protein involved in chromosome partitioning